MSVPSRFRTGFPKQEEPNYDIFYLLARHQFTLNEKQFRRLKWINLIELYPVAPYSYATFHHPTAQLMPTPIRGPFKLFR